MAEVTARLPYVCRPFSCLDGRTVDGASGPQCSELPVKHFCRYNSSVVSVDLIYQSPVHWSPELRWTDEKLRYDDDGRSNSAAPVRLYTVQLFGRTDGRWRQCGELPVKQHCTGCRRTAGAPSRNHYSTHYTPFLGKLFEKLGVFNTLQESFS